MQALQEFAQTLVSNLYSHRKQMGVWVSSVGLKGQETSANIQVFCARSYCLVVRNATKDS